MLPITLLLDPHEQTALQQLIDAALRHAGIAALEPAAHLARKLTEARAAQVQADARLVAAVGTRPASEER